MPIAFVLINAELGKEEDLTKELRKIENVKEVHLLHGVYDIIAKVEVESKEKSKVMIASNIRCLSDVRSTLTMIVVEGI